MSTWTISAPKEFQEIVKENAPKLGEGYAEFIHKAVYERVKRLSDKDFEKAKKRVKLIEKKKHLSVIRERETTWLREKGHKTRNIEKIMSELNDPELKKEFLYLIKDREKVADEVLKLDKEVNPIEIDQPKSKVKKPQEDICRKRIFNLIIKHKCGHCVVHTCKSCMTLLKMLRIPLDYYKLENQDKYKAVLNEFIKFKDAKLVITNF